MRRLAFSESRHLAARVCFPPVCHGLCQLACGAVSHQTSLLSLSPLSSPKATSSHRIFIPEHSRHIGVFAHRKMSIPVQKRLKDNQAEILVVINLLCQQLARDTAQNVVLPGAWSKWCSSPLSGSQISLRDSILVRNSDTFLLDKRIRKL